MSAPYTHPVSYTHLDVYKRQGIYLVIIIAGVVIFENIGFAGGGLEKNIHTASNSETQPVTVKDVSSETVSKTTPAVTVKETTSSQDVTKQESTVVTETETTTVASETSCESSEPETVQTEVQSTQPETCLLYTSLSL